MKINYLYTIYNEWHVIQCFGTGHFIVCVLRALFSTQYFFQGNFNIYFAYYFSICCLFNIYHKLWLIVGGKHAGMVPSPVLKLHGVCATSSGLFAAVLTTKHQQQLCVLFCSRAHRQERRAVRTMSLTTNHFGSSANGPFLIGRVHESEAYDPSYYSFILSEFFTPQSGGTLLVHLSSLPHLSACQEV